MGLVSISVFWARGGHKDPTAPEKDPGVRSPRCDTAPGASRPWSSWIASLISVSPPPLTSSIRHGHRPKQDSTSVAPSPKRPLGGFPPDDLDQRPQFDPTDPEPIPDDDFDHRWDG